MKDKAIEDQLEGLNLKKVRPLPYAGTYAIIFSTSLESADAKNRGSASWKKAEHIFIKGLQPDGGRGILPYWKDFINSDMSTDGHIQKLYIYLGDGRYRVFDAASEVVGEGTLNELLKR